MARGSDFTNRKTKKKFFCDKKVPIEEVLIGNERVSEKTYFFPIRLDLRQPSAVWVL
jgi:hypothetical protein